MSLLPPTGSGSVIGMQFECESSRTTDRRDRRSLLQWCPRRAAAWPRGRTSRSSWLPARRWQPEASVTATQTQGAVTSPKSARPGNRAEENRRPSAGHVKDAHLCLRTVLVADGTGARSQGGR